MQTAKGGSRSRLDLSGLNDGPGQCQTGDRRTAARKRHAKTAKDSSEDSVPADGPGSVYPEQTAHLMKVQPGCLSAARQLAGRLAVESGFPERSVDDLKLVVTELASNTLRHGGGIGWMRLWVDGPGIIVELSDSGVMERAIDSARPPPLEEGGRGIWIVRQLCREVHIRSTEDGTVVQARYC